MLGVYGPSTIMAIALGSVLAVVAFVPVVAIRYRKAGRLRFIDWILLIAGAVYFVALWTYTLIPLPDTAHYTCTHYNVHPFAFVGDIERSVAKSGHFSLSNPMLLQVVFNVLLFMPLGAFIRLLFRKGVVVATAVGFVITCIIETTQLTGDWWIYPCSYRTFDVDDLSMNTLGAFLGSLVILPVIKLFFSKNVAPTVTRVTWGRRLMGALADVMMMGICFTGIIIAWRSFEIYALRVNYQSINDGLQGAIGIAIPLIIQALWVFLDGRTFGEAVVDIRPVEGHVVWLRRLVKYIVGVGGFGILLGFGFPYSPYIMEGFCLVSLILIFPTRTHRGLTGILTAMDMQIDPDKPAGEPATYTSRA